EVINTLIRFPAEQCPTNHQRSERDTCRRHPLAEGRNLTLIEQRPEEINHQAYWIQLHQPAKFGGHNLGWIDNWRQKKEHLDQQLIQVSYIADEHRQRGYDQ